MTAPLAAGHQGCPQYGRPDPTGTVLPALAESARDHDDAALIRLAGAMRSQIDVIEAFEAHTEQDWSPDRDAAFDAALDWYWKMIARATDLAAASPAGLLAKADILALLVVQNAEGICNNQLPALGWSLGRDLHRRTEA